MVVARLLLAMLVRPEVEVMVMDGPGLLHMHVAEGDDLEACGRQSSDAQHQRRAAKGVPVSPLVPRSRARHGDSTARHYATAPAVA